MKILLATGIYPPDIGGPAQYARGVEEAWKKEGHEVSVLAFRFERKLPTGIRHLYYFLRVLFSLRGADFVFSPDTFSAALPALLAAKLCDKKIIVRTGGDFLWEQYVERAGDLVLLREFYASSSFPPLRGGDAEGRGGVPSLSLKERMIFRLVRFLFRRADAIVFSTAWQRDIFAKPYHLSLEKCFVIENYYGIHEKDHSHILKNMRMRKTFVGGVRDLKWKNLKRVEEAFRRVQKKRVLVELKVQTGSRGQFLQDIQDNYAVIIASLGDVSPNTILEAISFGRPFILTRETGLYEKLKDIGVWVDPENVDDIAAKIEWLADERNYEAQKKKVEAFMFTHSYEEIAEKILAVYSGLP